MSVLSLKIVPLSEESECALAHAVSVLSRFPRFRMNFDNPTGTRRRGLDLLLSFDPDVGSLPVDSIHSVLRNLRDSGFLYLFHTCISKYPNCIHYSIRICIY